jgi:hypothetical protein
MFVFTTNLDQPTSVSWRTVEGELVSPTRLQDVLLSGISNRKCMLYFGPIISNTIENFSKVEKCVGVSWKWHLHSPLWHSKAITSWNKPSESRAWSAKGVNNLGDIFVFI